MANPEHVNILRQGADAWYEWSSVEWNKYFKMGFVENFVVADFSGADLSGLDLNGCDLGCTDFRETILVGSNLSGANLEGAKFDRANMQEANFEEAEFMEASLVNVDLRNANLCKAGLVLVNLSKADLRSANLSDAYLQMANLTGANLSGAILSNAQYDDETIWPEGFIPPAESIKTDYWERLASDNSNVTAGDFEPFKYAIKDFDDKIVIHYSRGKQWLGLTLGLVMIAASIWCAGVVSQESMGLLFLFIVVTALFSLITFRWVKLLLTETESLIIDINGILIKEWRCGVIPWHDIALIWIENERYNHKHLFFHITNPTYVMRIPLPLRWVVKRSPRLDQPGDTVSLDMYFYKIPYQDIWYHLLKLRTISNIRIPLMGKEK